MHEETIKTCDLVAEAGAKYVKDGPKTLDSWVKSSLQKVKQYQSNWKKHCKKNPMTGVNWSSKTQAYKRISEWAVSECLHYQEKDLKDLLSK